MGLIGVFEHFGARKTKEAMALMQQMTTVTEGASSGGSWFARITSPPIIAPLSLSGYSILGMLTLFVRSEPSNSSRKAANSDGGAANNKRIDGLGVAP